MKSPLKSRPRHSEDEDIVSLEVMREYLASFLDMENHEKLLRCSIEVTRPIYHGAFHMQPASIVINTGSIEELNHIRKMALKKREEIPLNKKHHTCHFDGPEDQGRDTVHTKYLAYPDTPINSLQKKKDWQEGITEILGIMKNIMADKTMIVSFILRGPAGSKTADPTIQITNSYYVVHSEDILYRMISPAGFSGEVSNKGYMFTNFHSAGQLTSEYVSARIDRRRIYMDVEHFRSYSCNDQYAGNSMAPKKINHRFANMNNIRNYFGKRLDEHMFITGFPLNGEVIYFAGAYPSGCGKTGTAMTGSYLIGDDLAKIFIDDNNGEVRAVNPEKGMFGIIEGINQENDPEVIKVLMDDESEVIFSNILINDEKPYWNNMDGELPEQGQNYQGKWLRSSGHPASHKNSRFTINLAALKNYDHATEKPEGVKISCLLFGGRDYTTMPTIVIAHDWMNTVVHGAIIRSATTATEIGADGSEKRSPFANEAFFPAPLAHYINHYKAFGENRAIRSYNLPSGFQVNYWLHKSSRGLLAAGEKDSLIGEKCDTIVWMIAMALIHNRKIDTIWTPIGRIPCYHDLRELFKKKINKEYNLEIYNKQFSLYTDNLVKRIELSIAEFSREEGIIIEFFQVLNRWLEGIKELQKAAGEIVSPERMLLLNKS